MEPRDYPALYRMACDPARCFRWRFRGATPSPKEFEIALWEGVLAQFVIESTGDGRLLGLVVAYGANLRNGHAHIAIALDPGCWSQGWPLEGLALFVDYVFRQWNVRKLYAEVAGFNFERIASGFDRYCCEEGRLVEHEWHDGRYWDLHFLAVWRDQWILARDRVLENILPLSP